MWIAEGEPDTLVLAQTGLVGVGYPSASYRPTESECELLSTARRRFLAGDNDAAGTKTMADLQKRLRGATYLIHWPNNRKDANDVLTNECGNDQEKFKALIEDLKARAMQTETEPILRNGDEIPSKKINWLWEGKIPLGKITLFAGNPDNGKSLASTSVAAICTQGDQFPESTERNEPADVLLLLGEDDLEDTAVPRLRAAQAAMKRIHFLEAVRPVNEENREVRLDLDIPAIEKQLKQNSNIRLVIIDPISNYLGEVSMMQEQDVRSILIPLKRTAEKFNVAIVIIMHLNKKNDLDAISRVGGAMAFIGVARCSWLFARNVSEPEGEGEEAKEQPTEKKPDTFSMLRIKNNLVSYSRAGLSYSIAVRPVSIDGEHIHTPYVVWGTAVKGSADDALNTRRHSDSATSRVPGRPADKLQQAIRWLEAALQDGQPHESKKLIDAAKHAVPRIPRDNLDRAYGAMPGHVKPFPKGKAWYWQLEPLNETGLKQIAMPPQQSSLIGVEVQEDAA